MLSNELLNKILNNKHTKEIPIVFVWECITAFEQALKEVKENGNADISKLFDD